MVMVMLSVVGLVVGLVCWRRGLVAAVLERGFVSSLFGRPARALAGLAVEVAVAVAEMDHADGEALAVGIPDRAWALAAESLESLGAQARGRESSARHSGETVDRRSSLSVTQGEWCPVSASRGFDRTTGPSAL